MAAIVTCDTLRVRIWLCQSRAGPKPILSSFVSVLPIGCE